MMEVATGERSLMTKCAWLNVEVGEANRVIAVIVIPGKPSYELLLGRHWMADTGLLGNYRMGTYVIENDDGKLVPLPRASDEDSSNPIMNPEKLPRWININFTHPPLSEPDGMFWTITKANILMPLAFHGSLRV